ncbi:hypothetical protein D3C71_1151540 [compost metagenome]
MPLGGMGQGRLRIADQLDVCGGAEAQTGAVHGLGRIDGGPDMDLQPTLTGQAPAHDLTPQVLDRFAVLGFALLQHAGLNGLFAVGTQLGVRAGRRVLGLAHLGGDGQTALEQLKDLVVQAVDLGAQGGQRLLLGAQLGGFSGPDLLDIGIGHGIGLSAWISMGRSRPPNIRQERVQRPLGRSGRQRDCQGWLEARRLSRRIESRNSRSQNKSRPPRAWWFQGSVVRAART